MLNKSTNFATDKFVLVFKSVSITLKFYNYGRKESNKKRSRD